MFRASVLITTLIIIIFLGLPHSLVAVTSPTDFFQFTPGENFKLVSYPQLYDYFHELDRQSDRISCVEIGESTLGAPMFYAMISSPENLMQRQQVMAAQQALVNPDHKKDHAATADKVKTVISINCSIHAYEIGPAQMAPLLAFELAATQDSLLLAQLDDVIILLMPSQNPDGMTPVLEWYNEYRGTGFEKGPYPFDEHPYMGHSINRDWFALTQKETRNTVTHIYNQWFPHIVVDLHQLGKIGPRMVVPPYIDPYDDMIHPLLQTHMAELGSFVMTEMTRQGLGGVTCNLFFDSYSPSRSYTNYHHGLRFLTEVAATHLATPVSIQPQNIPKTLAFDPQHRSWRHPLLWDDTVWEPADVVTYLKNTCYAVIKYAAMNKERLHQHVAAISVQAADSVRHPSSFIVSKNQHDPYALELFLRTLQRGLVQIDHTDKAFRAAGETFSDGAFIIPAAQPFGYFVQTLLQHRPYPIASAPGGVSLSDITSHHLGYFYGLEVFEAELDLPAQRLEEIPQEQFQVDSLQAGENFIIKYESSRVLAALPELLDEFSVYWLEKQWQAEAEHFQAGCFYVLNPNEKLLFDIAQTHRLQLYRVKEIPGRLLQKIVQPKFAIYASYLPVEEEGWLRFLFDELGFDYTILRNSDIQKNDLSDYTAIILPTQESADLYDGYSENQVPKPFAGGLQKMGTDALIEYVENGGMIITIGLANDFIRYYFPVDIQGLAEELTFYEYQAPGVHLEMFFDNDSPLAFGMPTKTNVFALHPPVLGAVNAQHVGRYAEKPLQSGWMIGEEFLAETPGLCHLPLKKGSLVMMSFQPFFRAQSFNTIKVLLNALLMSTTDH